MRPYLLQSSPGQLESSIRSPCRQNDGFRVIARKDGDRVRLYSRPGNDLTYRFPLIVEALARLRSRSCIIDGEAVCCDDNGVPSFDRIRYRRHDASVFLYAFDLIELTGDDLRRDPLEVRKATLASVLAKAGENKQMRALARRAPPFTMSMCAASAPSAFNAMRFGASAIRSKATHRPQEAGSVAAMCGLGPRSMPTPNSSLLGWLATVTPRLPAYSLTT
jgi:ATP dependent DNA ligase domain